MTDQEKIQLVLFRALEALQAASPVSDRCGHGLCPQWPEWFALVNALNDIRQVLQGERHG
jgi:hypothetical protein